MNDADIKYVTDLVNRIERRNYVRWTLRTVATYAIIGSITALGLGSQFRSCAEYAERQASAAAEQVSAYVTDNVRDNDR